MAEQIVRYYGGKWKLGKFIIANFPKHRIFVDVFGGGANIILQKPPSKIEVFNDISHEVINFFEVLRDFPEELAAKIYLTPYSRVEKENAYIIDNDDKLERARKFIIKSWMSIGGGASRWKTGLRFRRNESNQPIKQWNTLPEKILKAAERFKNVIIENDDFEKIIIRYDSGETLFYCDPPYWSEAPSKWVKYSAGYLQKFSKEDHIRLADILHNVKGMVVISGFDSKLYNQLYKDWECIEKTAVNMNGKKYNEKIWLNKSAINNKFRLFEED